MNINWQKVGLFFLIIGAAIGFALIIYFFFFVPLFGTPTTTTSNTTTTTGTLSSAGNAGTRNISSTSGSGLPTGQSTSTIIQFTPTTANPSISTASNIKTLVADPVQFSSLSSNGQVTYYNPNDCKFYSVSGGGQINSLSSSKFCAVDNVVWAHNSDKAVMQYPDGSNVMYDFSTGKQVILPSHWQNFAFSPNDGQIVFKSIAIDIENRFLAIGDTNGSGLKILESIGGSEGQFQPDWSPNNQMVATFNQSIDMDRSDIFFIGLNNENFKSMTVEGRGFSGIWSPQGDKMAYSVYDTSSYSPQLWISAANSDNIGGGRQSINLQTWSDKCSFADENKLFCAVPQSMPYGAGLDRSMVDGIADYLYEIDLITGAQKPINIPTGTTINKIMAPSAGNYVMYYDSAGRIYRADY